MRSVNTLKTEDVDVLRCLLSFHAVAILNCAWICVFIQIFVCASYSFL